MLASLLRPRKSRRPVLVSASPSHETTPFLRGLLRDDRSLAPTEPDDVLNEQYGDEGTAPLGQGDDSEEGFLLPIFSSPHLGERCFEGAQTKEVE
jgi:hypothetical protein